MRDVPGSSPQVYGDGVDVVGVLVQDDGVSEVGFGGEGRRVWSV